MTRPIRDIIAEAMRRERLGLMRPLWAHMDDPAKEQWRLRADHLIRLLTGMGVKLECGAVETNSAPEMTSDTIWQFRVSSGSAGRIVRRSGEGFEIVFVEGGEERIEHTFTIPQAHVHCGMILMGDPSARNIPNLGKELAAALEAYRVAAVGAVPPSEHMEAAE